MLYTLDVSSERDPHQRFSKTVENYRLYRPRYPKGLCGVLAQHVELTPGTCVADLGAGTGILSEDLLDFGAKVIAVEPNEAMREAAQHEFGTRSGFHCIGGSAEETQLGDSCVQGIVAAQAFHWFDAQRVRREARRIGSDEVWAAIIWNTRRLERTPFLRAYETFCHQWGSDYAKVSARYAQPDTIATFFGRQPSRLVLDNAQELDQAALRGRLLSCSYIPGPAQARHADMLQAIEELFETHQLDGLVTLEYDTEVFWGRLNEPPNPEQSRQERPGSL